MGKAQFVVIFSLLAVSVATAAARDGGVSAKPARPSHTKTPPQATSVDAGVVEAPRAHTQADGSPGLCVVGGFAGILAIGAWAFIRAVSRSSPQERADYARRKALAGLASVPSLAVAKTQAQASAQQSAARPTSAPDPHRIVVAPTEKNRPRGKRWIEKEMTAYRYSECSTCTVRIRPGDRIWWDPYDKKARHAGYCLEAIAYQDASEERKRAAKEEATFMKLLDRVASAKGPASRKAILERAREMELTLDQRRQLLLEASRAETDATLEKVEGLKSKAAKRKRLEDTLAMLKSDSVEDELQADQISLLEDALRALEAEPEESPPKG